MAEKWLKTLDKGGETGATLIDLSNSFNCIDHNLLIPKLNNIDLKRGRYSLLILTSLSVNKEPKLTIPLVYGKYYSQVCH